MNNNIYEMLNDASIDTENYKEEQLNDMEKRKIKNTVLKKSSSRNKLFKTGVAAAAVVAITATSGVVFKNEVYAFVKSVQYKLNLFITAEDIDSYVQTINTTVEDGNIAVTLNEVVMDNDELIVTSTIEFIDGTEVDWIHASSDLVIDGQLIQGGASGSAMQTAPNTFEDYTVYNISGYNINPESVHNISYNLKSLLSITDNQQTEHNGKWNFSFTAQGSELYADTNLVTLTDIISLPNDCALKLTQYTSNSIGQKIYFDISGDLDYFVELRGRDDQNRDVVFYISSTQGAKGHFKIEPIDNGYIDADAKTLTLTPYILEMPKESGRMGNDYKPLDQEIVIHIQ